jgi:prepilin-type N-terminal cleavage/methylation domain-containing protein
MADRLKRRGFTLIELLTVIVIISILASLMLVVANLSRRRSQVARAKTEVRELAKAWKSYWAVYGEWPFGEATDREMTSDMMTYLLGANPQGIKFMDVSQVVVDHGFKDPWGNFYRMDFSRKVTLASEPYETIVYFPNSGRYLNE